MSKFISIGAVAVSKEVLVSLSFEEKKEIICTMCGVSVMSDEDYYRLNSERAVEMLSANDPHEEEEEEELAPETLRMSELDKALATVIGGA
jgi:hypothetical protein